MLEVWRHKAEKSRWSSLRSLIDGTTWDVFHRERHFEKKIEKKLKFVFYTLLDKVTF